MALENKYGKSAVDATRRNALPPYLDELFAGGIGGAGVETHDITLTTSGWSNLQQSVVLTCGATDSSDVICAANNTSMDSDYYMSTFGVSLSNVTVVEGEEEGQNTVTFTFTAVTTPTVNIDVVVVIVNADSSGGVPVATTSRVGVVKPDGTTISVDSNGTIHSIGSVGTVSGVKGNAESAYRTGNVNITPANIGISKAVQVSDSPISLTQTGSEMQTILNTVGDGKFVWLNSVNTTLYDEIPQAKASWFAGYYDPNWANRPTDYGLIYMMTVGNAGVRWAYEYAIAVGAEAGQMFVRTTNNGETWSSWKKVVEEDFRYISVTPNTTYIRSDANAVTCSILNGVAYVTGLFIMEANVPANDALLYSALPRPRDGVTTYCFIASNSATAHRLKLNNNGQLLTDGTTPLTVASWYSICISYPTND